MTRSRLLVGIASVFAGLSAFLAVLGFVENPLFLVIAIPFGLVTYVLWYHTSGRLRARVRRQARTSGFGPAGERRARDPRGRRPRGDGGFGAGPREEWRGPRSGSRGRRANVGAGRADREAGSSADLSATEAYSLLGLDPGADADRVKQAYRERVKHTHPDAEGGDEAAFKRVQKAYERLQS